MKIPLLLALFAVTTLAVSPSGHAQEAPATPAASALGLETPTQAIDRFFQSLSRNDVDGAYNTLLKGSKIWENPKDVALLKAKTNEAIKAFGAITGAEAVETKKVGTHLTNYVYLSLGKDFPMRWRFYFYENQGHLRLIDIRISDRLSEMFGEAAPAGASAQ